MLVPLTASSFQLGDITVSGSNRLEWWEWREKPMGLLIEKNSEVFDDKFDIDVYYRNFLLGFRYQVVEPSNVALPGRREGFHRRYIEYDSEKFGIRAGNYYVIFGRGLILRAYEDDIIYLDRDIDGVKVRGSTKWADVVAISGRPRNTEFLQLDYEVVNDTTDIIRGGDLSLHPLPFMTAGGSYVLLLTAKNQFDTSAVSFKRTEIYGTNLSLSIPNIEIYGEIAKKWGWDTNLDDPSVPFNFGGIGQGYGIYGSASLSFPGYGITVQFADYDSIGLGEESYRYNSPPALNRYGQALNKGLDEKGYQIESFLSPLEPLNIELSYSHLKTEDEEPLKEFREAYVGVTYQKYGLFDLRTSLDKTEQHGIIEGFADFNEQIPGLELVYSVTPVHSVGLGFQHRAVSGSVEFTDKKLYLMYTFTPYFTVTLTGEQRDEEIMDIQGWEGTEWRALQIDWDITQDHRLNVMVGTQKGGLVCSGGICRYESSFDGVKAILISRF